MYAEIGGQLRRTHHSFSNLRSKKIDGVDIVYCLAIISLK